MKEFTFSENVRTTASMINGMTDAKRMEQSISFLQSTATCLGLSQDYLDRHWLGDAQSGRKNKATLIECILVHTENVKRVTGNESMAIAVVKEAERYIEELSNRSFAFSEAFAKKAEEMKKDPSYFFQWAEGPMAAAAEYALVKELNAVVERDFDTEVTINETLEKIYAWLLREILSQSRWCSPKSTSRASDQMKAYRLEAFSKEYESLGWVISFINQEDK